MKVALIQVNSNSDLENNFKKFLYFLEISQINGSDLAIFPENLFYIGNMDNYKNTAIKIKNEYWQKIYEAVREFKIDVILGGIPFLNDENKLVNRLFYINKDGEIEAFYDKIHLFSLENSKSSLNEATYLTRGKETVILKKNGFTLGFSICYDLRFPELYRKLIDKGADVLIVTAAFTYKTGKLHWQTLLRARAIENQAYVLGVNQVGVHENYGHSYGKTSVVKPVGEIICLNEEDEDVLFFELDKNDISHYRNWIPALKNRVEIF